MSLVWGLRLRSRVHSLCERALGLDGAVARQSVASTWLWSILKITGFGRRDIFRSRKLIKNSRLRFNTVSKIAWSLSTFPMCALWLSILCSAYSLLWAWICTDPRRWYHSPTYRPEHESLSLKSSKISLSRPCFIKAIVILHIRDQSLG